MTPAEILQRAKYLGFKNVGPSTPYEQSRFPHTQWVQLSWPDGTTSVDAIKGLNAGHAMARAAINWPAAANIHPLEEKAGRTAYAKEIIRERFGGGAGGVGKILPFSGGSMFDSEISGMTKNTVGRTPLG